MAKYYVYFVATASSSVEVEADSQDEAEERAYDEFDFPGVLVGNEFDLGDWVVEEIEEVGE